MTYVAHSFSLMQVAYVENVTYQEKNKFDWGYPHIRGERLNSDQLGTLYEGLTVNQLNNYDFLLTGKDRLESCKLDF